MDTAFPLEKDLGLTWEFRPEGGSFSPAVVPGPWQRFLPGFHGRGEYRTFLRRSDGEPFFMRFEAVATEARVLVNGREAGGHLGAWTPFVVDLTPHLHEDLSQPDEIVVRVDEKPGHATAGFLPWIDAAFGGIWGGVTRAAGPPPAAPPPPIDMGIRVNEGRIEHNGRPILLRGILHWGYYPELGAPMPDRAAIDAEIAAFKSLGFNMVKFCLFVPPERYLEACDAAGLWIWQEYPLWNQPLVDPALLAEFEEFLRIDSRHPSVIIRSFTCENDRVDLCLAQRLHAMARRYAPHGLVLDNSAWISAEETGDFYDEHPYLHNGEWRYYHGRIRRALAGRPVKPFLLGETMAVDTWTDLSTVEPDYAESQRGVENDAPDPGVHARSLRIAGSVRRHQAETLRREMPGAGYCITGLRDIGSAPLGISTWDGRPKFTPGSWAWQGDTALLCDLEERSFPSGSTASVTVWVSHYGEGRIDGEVLCRFDGKEKAFPLRMEPGETRAVGKVSLAIPDVDAPRAYPLEAALGELCSAWNVWAVPRPAGTSGVRVADALDVETLAALEGGADVILCAGPRKGSWKSPNFTWWSPVIAILDPAISGGAIGELVEELVVFDLLSGRVLAPAAGLQPLVEVRDAHMEPGKMIRHPLVAATRVGAGRLLVSALRHGTPAGVWLLEYLARRLEQADPPALGRLVPADSVVLEDWEMSLDGRSWLKVKCDTALVNAGRNVYEGWALFRTSFEIPGAWKGREAALRCEAVGDAYIVTIDGGEIGRAGNLTGVWDGTRDKPVEFPLTLEPGAHEISVKARDWRGNGGMIGPVLFTRTPDSLIY